MSRIRAIVNPAAAGGRGRKAARTLLRTLAARDIALEPLYTEAPGHASRLARAAVKDGTERLIVVGGDGTIHEVAQGLLGAAPGRIPAVVLHPVGTGNDFFRMIGRKRGVRGVVATLLGGRVERFDAGRARWEGGERVFVNLLGTGIDVDILRRRSRFRRLPGLLQYLAALVSAMASFRPRELVIELDAGSAGAWSVGGPTTIAAITVGPSIGGGFRVNPKARATDGRLDLCHFGAVGWLSFARLVPRVIRGRHGDSSVVAAGQFRRAVVRRPGGDPFHFEVDGELVAEPVRELQVEVIPGALPVMVPDRGGVAR